ncbi:VWA domain-containing protein [Helicobacter bizzozeronii]|uniref:vWA domain-containing protein n=1 Tax=Helicobacter bizzozeronii TaxID=56877 RepID=UPI00244D83D4|nr:VWA domain-containing protein [Helicobacter bizzozeronii]GMB92793.1 VWA domain-containing protein [Helicobacter bizzozeronii]
MSDLDTEHTEELADNPTKRVPVCLCLDTSGSMEGDPIEQLNGGVELFYKEVNDHPVARQAADVCIVTFGDNGVSLVQDFQSIRDESAPRFSASGGTPMGEAVNRGLDRLEERKQEYKDSGTEYFQPWLVIISDGAPTDDISSACKRTSDMAKSKKLTIFPIIVEDGDASILRQFSPPPLRPPVKLKDLEFKEFFRWLAQSVVRVSQSRPGEKVTLPDMSEWAEMNV